MSAVIEMNYKTFYNCKSLVIEDANFPNLTGKVCNNFHKTKLRKISNLGSITEIENGRYDWGFCFNCVELTDVVLPSTLAIIGSYAFYGCPKLKTVVMNANTPPSLDASSFTGTHSELLFYVPDKSLTAYCEATNWSAYADRILPLSEYAEYKNYL